MARSAAIHWNLLLDVRGPPLKNGVPMKHSRASHEALPGLIEKNEGPVIYSMRFPTLRGELFLASHFER